MKLVFDGTYHFKNSLLLSANQIEGFTDKNIFIKNQKFI